MSGRPLKENLDFSSWDVSILENDEKIDMLIDSQGIAAFTVYFYLCQKAYGSKGYYLDWGYSRCATVARRLGKGASADFVKQVVDMCFQCCLFDKRLFELYGILTSKGIQKRFLFVAKERTKMQINPEYWLLENDENEEGFDFHTQKSNYDGLKSNYDGSKFPIKESKGKYIKRESREKTTNTVSSVPTLSEIKNFVSEEKLKINPDKFYYYYQSKNWKGISDWKAKAREWNACERKPESNNHFAGYDLEEFEKMLNGEE